MLQRPLFYPIQIQMQLKFQYGRFMSNKNLLIIENFYCRDSNQDSLDLDKIDETRPNNQLNTSYISLSQLNVNTSTIYDAVQDLPICFNVPSGIYIEFGFVRVSISPTVSFERIISVQYKYVILILY
jgi:hypothetical protein